MTDTNPPADRTAEADAAIRAIAATKYHPAPWTSEYDSFGTDINLGPHFQVSDASGHFIAATESDEVHVLLMNAVSDIERLSARVEDLEGQLAKVEGWSVRIVNGEVELRHGSDERKLSGWDIPLGAVLAFITDAAEEPTTAPDTAMDEFEAADEMYRRWE